METCCHAGPGYSSPLQAYKNGPREDLLFVTAVYTGTKTKKPDFLAVVDSNPESKNYSKIISRLNLPYEGDELHHFGWNACSSCFQDSSKQRRFLVLLGQQSTRIYIIDTEDPQNPKIHHIIQPEVIIEKTGFTAPHTAHCLASGYVMVSMLGDQDGNPPGGFILISDDFKEIKRWEATPNQIQFNYDFWYQPRLNVMVSSEWAAPSTYYGGFNPVDVANEKYGHRLYFWDWQKRVVIKTVDLGSSGMIPLELRFLHEPSSSHGYVGVALSSTVFHWYYDETQKDWVVEQVLQLEGVKTGNPESPELPALISDVLISLDDRYLFVSQWLKGEIHQYDITERSNPQLVGQVKLGGKDVAPGSTKIKDSTIRGGPQMIQLSLDGKRLYVTNSLFSSWDNQFYPQMIEKGSHLIQLNVDTEKGGLTVDENFFVDFGNETHGPALAHEVRYPGGDCTSDIWL